MIYHKPALLEESIRGLDIKPKGKYADLTFGGGGHSRKILGELDENGKLLVFDQDKDAQKNVEKDDRLIFIHSNFRYLKNFLRYHNIEMLDGILADLGISSHQIDVPERGFSHREDARLDMRMNDKSSLTAEMVVNEYSAEELYKIFSLYGELPGSGKLSNRIVKYREEKRIVTSGELIEVVAPLLPKNHRIKFLSMLFQAIRIEVNDEMGALEELLKQVPEVLSQGGRLVILSYHSIEDRMVKNFIKAGNVEGRIQKDFYGNFETPLKAVNRNVIIAGEAELNENPRARSAKLRIAERI